MKTTILFAILFCFFLGNIAFGDDAESVYIDSGLISYCRSSYVNHAVVTLFVRSIASEKTPKDYFLGSTYPTYFPRDVPQMLRFPLAWSVENSTLRVITPDVVSSAMNNVMFQFLMIEDISMPDKDLSNRVHEVYTEHHDDTTVHHHSPVRPRLGAWVSGAFSVNFLRDSRNVIIWYGFSGTNFIVRFPLTKELVDHSGDVWMPCASPAVYRWMEFRYAGWDSDGNDLTVLHSEDFPPDGFSPVGSVRIAGKRVLSDDPRATFPSDADWLIWEKDGDAYRLCQMRGGRWSVSKDAPRTDAPKIIVINNDTNTVFLLYSMEMNANDVGGSLEKVVAFLKSRGALQLAGDEKESQVVP